MAQSLQIQVNTNQPWPDALQQPSCHTGAGLGAQEGAGIAQGMPEIHRGTSPRLLAPVGAQQGAGWAGAGWLVGEGDTWGGGRQMLRAGSSEHILPWGWTIATDRGRGVGQPLAVYLGESFRGKGFFEKSSPAGFTKGSCLKATVNPP